MLIQKRETETEAATQAATRPWWREAAQETALTASAPSPAVLMQNVVTPSAATPLQETTDVGASLEAEARRRARLSERTQVIHADKSRQLRRLRKEAAWGWLAPVGYAVLVMFTIWPDFRPSLGVLMT